jgi:hypothetical protein
MTKAPSLAAYQEDRMVADRVSRPRNTSGAAQSLGNFRGTKCWNSGNLDQVTFFFNFLLPKSTHLMLIFFLTNSKQFLEFRLSFPGASHSDYRIGQSLETGILFLAFWSGSRHQPANIGFASLKANRATTSR